MAALPSGPFRRQFERAALSVPQDGGCTYVAWSPDGAWMYFSSDAGGHFHIWRQRFPDGVPQQLTSGATEEEGIAVAPDGRSLITSVGLVQSTIMLHDVEGRTAALLGELRGEPAVLARRQISLLPGSSPRAGTELAGICSGVGSSFV